MLNSFERLAAATKRAISTDLPQDLLPAVVDLSQKVKNAKLRSLNFVPPLINTADPDWYLIRRKVSDSLEEPASTKTAPAHSPSTTPGADTPVNLDATCA
ncbi:hypothetical protein ACFQQB_23400 [Nonomuraea rubra]|uniref:hypothetical protein n=1 Tax=Nonomuraea rubra TaxID=46180 RepID=UPI003622D329